MSLPDNNHGLRFVFKYFKYTQKWRLAHKYLCTHQSILLNLYHFACLLHKIFRGQNISDNTNTPWDPFSNYITLLLSSEIKSFLV